MRDVTPGHLITRACHCNEPTARKENELGEIKRGREERERERREKGAVILEFSSGGRIIIIMQ